MLGPDQPMILHLLDIEQAGEALNGVSMELIDSAFPLLKGMSLILRANSRQIELFSPLRFLKPCHEYCSTGVVHTTDVVEACKDVNIAIMVGGIPRKEGMERNTMLSKNVSIYKAQASALEQHAAADCKVRNPINVLECVDIRFQ